MLVSDLLWNLGALKTCLAGEADGQDTLGESAGVLFNETPENNVGSADGQLRRVAPSRRKRGRFDE